MLIEAEPQALPRWAAVADAIAVFAIALGIAIAISGGFRESTPLGRISMTDGLRPMVFAGVVIVLRHWRHRRPTLIIRARRAIVAWRESVATRAVLPVFLVTRVGVLLVGFVAIVLLGYAPDTPPYRVHDNDFLNLPARWDTGWYMGIAERGYEWKPDQVSGMQNIAFFPAFPLAMRYLSLPLGRETLWTGVFISLAAFFGALHYLFLFARSRIGEDGAATAVALIASYPFALFFSAAYSEGLFLLAAIAACYHFERDELGWASAWGLLAGLTRPNGSFLSVVLLLLALRHTTSVQERLIPKLCAAAAPGIGIVLYSAYIYLLTGNPLQWARNHAAYGRVYRGVFDMIGDRVRYIEMHGLYGYVSTLTLDWINGVPMLLAIVAIWPIYRLLGIAYAALVAINVAIPMLIGGVLSMGRLTATMFPVFVWLAVAIPPKARTAWFVAFAMLQALFAVAFFTWRPLY